MSIPSLHAFVCATAILSGLKEFVEHYHHARPHQALGQRTPCGDLPTLSDRLSNSTCIVRLDRLGGLINEYSRQAA